MEVYPFSRRRLTRAYLVELIYRVELLEERPEEVLRDIARRERLGEERVRELESLAEVYSKNRARLDEAFAKVLKNWRPERVLPLDRAIIKAGAVEALAGVPHPVAISEAVELAKALSTEKSPKFVNGVLDAMIKELCGEGSPYQ